MRLHKSIPCYFFLILLISACASRKTVSPPAAPHLLPGFTASRYWGEQERVLAYDPEVRAYINAPAAEMLDASRPLTLVLYPLPNGNSIEQTAGKRMQPGDDWHYDIQHIAAQTRYLRRQPGGDNLVVAYLECRPKSWPAWKRAAEDRRALIPALIDSLRSLFPEFETRVTLSGHSGGGSFVNGYIEQVEAIPAWIERIAFLDSNYGYDDDIGAKLAAWLKRSAQNRLCVLAYNDSIALYQGKPFVSPTGGTWYRSKMMARFLAEPFNLNRSESDDFIEFHSPANQVEIILKKNPERKIFHTVQVERNGFIHSMYAGTAQEGQGYQYFGERVYDEYIAGIVPAFRALNIPSRPATALSGSELMRRIEALPFAEREEVIRSEILEGNLPEFLHQGVTVETVGEDAAGEKHHLRLEVLPDYLAVGSDSDFCRFPLGPKTAQQIADRFGAIMPTREIVDLIYEKAAIKLAPVTYTPLGSNSEQVWCFEEHQRAIEQQRREAEGQLGWLTAGIKKDVIIHSRIADPNRTHHVVIYGWHWPDGSPIQPVTNIHIASYVDYSHGIRLINSQIYLDGFPREISEVLCDSTLYKLLSSEVMTPETIRY
ncbi:MAG: hypothetical protein KDI38_15360 [Calditrichaeota bacterium]|nr:hypothetical protein [Calditrichota bacterium]